MSNKRDKTVKNIRTPYIFFAMDMRVKGVRFSSMTAMSDAWNSLTDEQKLPYDKLYEDDKIRHASGRADLRELSDLDAKYEKTRETQKVAPPAKEPDDNMYSYTPDDAEWGKFWNILSRCGLYHLGPGSTVNPSNTAWMREHVEKSLELFLHERDAVFDNPPMCTCSKNVNPHEDTCPVRIFQLRIWDGYPQVGRRREVVNREQKFADWTKGMDEQQKKLSLMKR